MDEPKEDAGRVLRFVASGGWANEDPEVVAALLDHAHRMATLILADGGTPAHLRAAAEDFLDLLRSDAFAAE
ncbi:MAG TPA: hypothetical protein VIX82_09680 [Solirubrobacteraceae bacterium]